MTDAVRTRVRYLSLDLWRGAAALAVAVSHVLQYCVSSDGGAGISAQVSQVLSYSVALFFVICGYCITATIQSHSSNALDYFRRRIRRIYPPYCVLLMLTFAYYGAGVALGHDELVKSQAGLIYNPAPFSLTELIANATLTHIWLTPLLSGHYHILLGPSWSLGYEEQFYVVCGLMFALSKKRFFAFALVLAVGQAILLGVRCVAPALVQIQGGFFFDGHWLMFGMGVLVYWTVTLRDPRRRIAVELSMVVLAVALLLAYPLYAPSFPHRPYWVERLPSSLVVAAAFAALLSFLQRRDAQIAESRLGLLLSWVGLRSYSLYIVHAPVIVFSVNLLRAMGVPAAGWGAVVASVVAYATALLLSVVFFERIERRFLSGSNLSRVEAVAPGTALRWTLKSSD